MKLKNLNWKEAPGHPSLRYVEIEVDGQPELILDYHGTYVHTTWDKIGRAVALWNVPLRKSNKPNLKTRKRGIRSIMPEPHTQNKKCGVSLFVRLVADGEIQRATGEC